MNGTGCFLPILGLLVAFQPSLNASTALPIGTTTGNGEVRLNGVPIPSGAVLYNGDRIATGPANATSIHLRKDDDIVLGTSTDVRISVNSAGFLVKLNRGRVAAVSMPEAPIVVIVNGVTVESAQPGGSYEVALRGNELKVLTRRGTTLIEGAGRTVKISAGTLMKAALAQGLPSRKRTKLLMVTIIAAAAAVGLGIAVAAPGTTCVSPSQMTCP